MLIIIIICWIYNIFILIRYIYIEDSTFKYKDSSVNFSLDVSLYNKWGNGPDDTTSWLGRRIGVVD